MAKGQKVHRMGLACILVEGNSQPINQNATLTLKDEDQNKHVMQVHVDGRTLKQWDLGMLGELQSKRGVPFYSRSEHKCLQFRLPLSRQMRDGLIGNVLKTVQLFLINHHDFHTAISYLSKDAGLQHEPLEDLLQPSTDTAAPEPSFTQRHTRESSGPSTIGPPLRYPGHAPSNPFKGSPVPNITRPHTARPGMAFSLGGMSRRPNRSQSAVPFNELMSSQAHLPLLNATHGVSGVSPQDSSGQARHVPSGSLGGERDADITQLYATDLLRSKPSYSALKDIYDELKADYDALKADLAPSACPAQYNGRESTPLRQQGGTKTDYVLNQFHNHAVNKHSAGLAGNIPSSASRTYVYEASAPSATPFATPTPQLRSTPVRGMLVRIEVLDPSVKHKYPLSSPRTLLEFSLTLLPSTKMGELCRHAASFVNQNFRYVMGGSTFVAQSREGTVFEDQEILSASVTQEETIFLLERRPLGLVQPNPAYSRMPSMDPLHPDWTSPAPNPQGPGSIPSRNPHLHTIDEDDRVPPPRKLPFSSIPTNSSKGSSSSTAPAQPLRETPDLVNASARTPASQQTGKDRTEAASKKRPASRRSQSPAKRPASAASAASSRRLRSSEATQHPEPLNSKATRPASAARNKRVGPSKAAQHVEPLDSMGQPVIFPSDQDKGEMPSDQEAVSQAFPSGKKQRAPATEATEEEVAANACMSCRNKRRKCDEVRPTCGLCLEDNRKCVYRHSQVSTGAGSSQKGIPNATSHSKPLESSTLPPKISIRDVTSQISPARKTQDTAIQTEETKQEKKDVGTDPHSLPIDTSTETNNCDDIWLPLSQSTELVLWAQRQFNERRQKAIDIFMTTDLSQKDYIEKVEQAAAHYIEFQEELREKCEEVLQRSA